MIPKIEKETPPTPAQEIPQPIEEKKIMKIKKAKPQDAPPPEPP
jgi:hypothetical protein